MEAHLLPEVSKELAEESGKYFEILTWAVKNCGLAFTEEIESHWGTRCRRDRYFWQWLSSQSEAGLNVIEVPRELATIAEETKHRINRDYKLPLDNNFTWLYIACASAIGAPRYILAEEMELYEPQQKGQSTKYISKILKYRTGSLCKYLEKALKIRVGDAKDFIEYFELGTGNCRTVRTKDCTSCHSVPS